MKVHFNYLFLASAILSGCEKPNSTTTTIPPTNQITITVLEKGTNQPIPNTNLTVYKCRTSDIVSGRCLDYSIITTLSTNNLGQATFRSGAEIAKISPLVANYWLYDFYPVGDSSIKIILAPACTIRALLKKINTYSTTDFLNVTLGNIDCPTCISFSYNFGLPSDSTVFMKGEGNTRSQVFWSIGNSLPDSLHSLPPFYVNRFDTANIEIKY